MKIIFKILNNRFTDRICCFFGKHEYGKTGEWSVGPKHWLTCRVCKKSIDVDNISGFNLYGITPKQYWEWKKKYFNWL